MKPSTLPERFRQHNANGPLQFRTSSRYKSTGLPRSNVRSLHVAQEQGIGLFQAEEQKEAGQDVQERVRFRVPRKNRARYPDLADDPHPLPARHRSAETGGGRRAAAARAVRAAGAGLRAAVLRRVPHGPGLRPVRQRRHVHPGRRGGAAGDDPPSVQGPATAPLRVLPAAAAHEGEALPDLQALRAALRSPLPLDRELRRGEKSPLVRPLPAGAAAGAALGLPPRLVWLQLRPHLEDVAAAERLPPGGLPGGGGVRAGGGPLAGLPPLPGVPQHHHLGVHVPPPHLLPQALRRRREPLRPGRPAQPAGLLLRVPHRGLGGGVLPAGQRPRLAASPPPSPGELGGTPALSPGAARRPDTVRLSGSGRGRSLPRSWELFRSAGPAL